MHLLCELSRLHCTLHDAIPHTIWYPTHDPSPGGVRKPICTLHAKMPFQPCFQMTLKMVDEEGVVLIKFPNNCKYSFLMIEMCYKNLFHVVVLIVQYLLAKFELYVCYCHWKISISMFHWKLCHFRKKTIQNFVNTWS